MATDHQRILILCKTYPSPSGKHIETSCVAGLEEGGRLIRLFPVPFRLVGDEKQFKIISIDPQEHRLGLSLRAVAEPKAEPKESKTEKEETK